MEVNKARLLLSIRDRLEEDARKVQAILESGSCNRHERKQLHGRMNELIKQLARAQSAISQHTVKNEQLAKLTATAQSAEDALKARELIRDSLEHD